MPTGRIDRLIEWWIESGLERERQPISKRRLILTGLAFVVVVAGPFVRDHYSNNEWLVLFVAFPTAALAGAGTMHVSGFARRIAFQRGYRAGRNSWWDSMVEAQRRGLEPAEWMRGEAERDRIALVPYGDDDDE